MADDLTEYLAGVKARAERATEGPWIDVAVLHPSAEGVGIGLVESPTGYPARCNNGVDTTFIAHARTDVPTLHAMVEAVLALHVPTGVYDLADDCSCDRDAPGYDDVHTENADGDLLCRVRVLWWACRECSGDHDEATSHPCPTVRAMTAVLDRKENER